MTDSQMTAATIDQPTIVQRRGWRTSEERHLARRRRRAKARAIQITARIHMIVIAIEPQPPARDREALVDQLGEVARAGHAAAEARIVLAPVAHLAHDADHVLRALRI